MTLRYSRRRAMQAAMATAAVATMHPSPTTAREATPTVVDHSAISADQVAAALPKLDSLIENAMARLGVPGAAVAVVYDDAVVYERALGVREANKPAAVTPETVFQLASMSKSISSTLVAAVIGDGATTWDAVAAELLPGFALSDPWWSAQVTLRDLFSHRSGLPGYAGDGLTATFGYGRDESVHRLRYIPPASPLRTSFAYTNLGLSVASYAAAKATGRTWEDLADERLFGPLGMAATSYRFADYMGRSNRAAPHYRSRQGAWALGEVTDADASAPAGGISTNVRDLTQWVRLQLAGGAFEGNQLVASDPLLETRRPQILEASPANPADGPASFYGLGWRLTYDDRGRLHVEHIGDFSSGFRTGVSLLPATGLGIVVLSNAWPNSLADAIPKAFFEIVERGEESADWIGIYEEQTAEGLAALSAAAPFPHGDAPANEPSLPLDAYTGAYTNLLYGEIVVREESGGLVLELGSLPTTLELVHWDRDVFTYPLPPSGEVLLGKLGVEFMIGPASRATTIAFGLPTVGPDATAWFTRRDP
ncbi:MAG TPA: serine hydrolase [Thermomicrobiales bacterium]|nr:serine hydrolase [Thermomicrobiales bacterium]